MHRSRRSYIGLIDEHGRGTYFEADEVTIRRAGTPQAATLANRRLYKTWYNMVDRCTRSTHKDYKHYGGRGIRVCVRWLRSFRLFVQDMGYPLPGYTLDRRNNDGNYTPSNCRWATRSEQRRNQRVA